MKSFFRIGMAVFCLSVASFAASVILQNGLNGYTGCSDTYLVQASASVQGAKTNMVVEGYHCSFCVDQRALIRFDLSALPVNANIASATLSLYSIDQPRPGASQINVHRVTKKWSESNATWFTAETGSLWASAGGDFNAAADTSYTYGVDVGVWHSVDVTAMIRDQIRLPAQNFGLALYMIHTMLTVRYASSNNADPNLRPKLILAGSGLTAIQSVAPHMGVVPVFSLENKMNLIRATMSGHLSMTDLSGRQIASGNGLTMDVSGVSSGMYLVSLITKNASVDRRIIISR